MLRREGFRDNVKRVYRVYREAGLTLRVKRPHRNKAAQLRQPKRLAHTINETWNMNFVADTLFDGRKLRILIVVDLYAVEYLAKDVGQSLKGEDEVRVLDSTTQQRGLQQPIKSENGSEFISKVMDKWAYERSVKLDFSQQGTPKENADVESFYRRLRQECLNANWFTSLEDPQAKTSVWRSYYNKSRLHSGYIGPRQKNSPVAAGS